MTTSVKRNSCPNSRKIITNPKKDSLPLLVVKLMMKLLPKEKKPKKAVSNINLFKNHQKKKKTQSKNQHHAKTKDLKPKESGNKSRFNNFGGFLIGSLAEILLKARAYRISNGNYEILESGQFVSIYKSNILIQEEYSDVMMTIIRKLKREVEQLPRK